jgi:ParB-like chromosome segregation protein Spo0J
VKKNNAKTLICDEISIKIPKISNFVITELKTDGKNPNKMTEKQKTALKKNIKEFGFIVPIITNEDLVIADGEHRWICAKELGMREVPVVRLPLKEVDRRILRQVLNKLKGQHDYSLDLNEYFEIIKEKDINEFSSYVGLDEKYLKDVLDSAKELPEEYLELRESSKLKIEDGKKFIKLVLTKEQKDLIKKKIESEGDLLFDITDYFFMGV